MSLAGSPRPDTESAPETDDAPREAVTPAPDPETLFFGDPFALAGADDARGAGPADDGAARGLDALGLDAVEEAFFRASEFPQGVLPHSPEAAEPPRPRAASPLREAPWSQDATTRPGLGDPTPKAVTAKASTQAPPAPRSAGTNAGKAARKPAKTRPKQSAAAAVASPQATPPAVESGLAAQLEAAGDITDRDLQPPTFTGESPAELPLRPLFLSQAISVFQLQWVKPVATWDERLQRRFKLFAKVIFGAALLCFGYFADVLSLRTPKANGGAAATPLAPLTDSAAKRFAGQNTGALGRERSLAQEGDGTPEVNAPRGVAPSPEEAAPRAAGSGEPGHPEGPQVIRAEGARNFEAALALRPGAARARRADPHRAGTAAPATAAPATGPATARATGVPVNGVPATGLPATGLPATGAATAGVPGPDGAPGASGGAAPANTGPVDTPAAMPGLNPPPALAPKPTAPSRNLDIIRESGALPPPPGGPIPIEEP